MPLVGRRFHPQFKISLILDVVALHFKKQVCILGVIMDPGLLLGKQLAAGSSYTQKQGCQVGGLGGSTPRWINLEGLGHPQAAPCDPSQSVLKIKTNKIFYLTEEKGEVKFGVEIIK